MVPVEYHGGGHIAVRLAVGAVAVEVVCVGGLQHPVGAPRPDVHRPRPAPVPRRRRPAARRAHQTPGVRPR